MSIKIKDVTEVVNSKVEITCANCHASCCHYEVTIISDTGVPARHISENEWGVEVMLRLEDGWCSALDRDTKMCTIYDKRPWVCREFEMASYDCENARKTYMRAE